MTRRMRTFDNKAELIAHLGAGYNNSQLPEQLETAAHHFGSIIFYLHRQISRTCGPSSAGDANDGTNGQLTDTFFFQMIRNIISIALSRQIRIAATRGERRFFFFFKMKISGSRPAHLSAANQLLAFFMFSLLTLCMLPFHGSQIPRVRERGAKAESHHHHFNIITSHRQINSVRQPK